MSVVLQPRSASVPAEAPLDVREPSMHALFEIVERVAASTIGVLLLGETGVGKDLMARTIHDRSPRRARPFLSLNCAAFPEHLLESELFGYEKGAFTGADRAKLGLLESADGGTVFLDEVGEMPAAVQAKLLRVIEDRQVMRVGALAPRAINLRFISATNRDLPQMRERGEFRGDLYFRLNGISLVIPPLRERPSEIIALAQRFVTQACASARRAEPRLSDGAKALLAKYDWPGNIRELRNTIDRAAVLADATIESEHLALGSARASAPNALPPALHDAVDELERQRILATLERCGGNQSRAARELGISRGMLLSRLKAYGVHKSRRP